MPACLPFIDPIFQDATFEFEKRRNVPVRYDRELVATTLKAMERVAEIRQKREKAFWKNRYVYYCTWSFISLTTFCSMSGNAAKNIRDNALEIERHIELVQPRSSTSTSKASEALEEREKVREKIKVRAAGRKAMALQQMGKGKKQKESRLIPAEGGSMGMSLD